jgi:pilus assembly protein CpaB
MLNRRSFFLILAIVVGFGTMMMMRASMNHKTEVADTSGVEILVAAENIQAGQFLQTQHVRWQSWAPDHVTEAFIRRHPEAQEGEGAKPDNDVTGAVARKGIKAGEPILAGEVVKPKDRGFLAAVLDPGKRAVAVPITNVTGIAGFVFPGDRVDLILTHAINDTKDESGVGQRRASTTITRDVRVLALDQDTNDQNDNKPKVAKVITLEVDPKQAEILTLALQMGTLSLSLRSLAQETGPDGKPLAQDVAFHREEITLDSEVSHIIPPPIGPREFSSQVVQVLRGSQNRKADEFKDETKAAQAAQ